MLITTPRPRSELSVPLADAPTNLIESWYWGEPKGSESGRIIAPSSLNPGRNFDPINMLLFGRRGQGKTLTLTAICSIFHKAYWNPALGPMRGKRRIASNYYIRFAQNAGPLGYELGSYEDDEGNARFGKVPVDPCDPEHPYRMAEFPTWAAHRLMAVDEIADILASVSATSRVVKDWASVFRQQRKMRTEYLAATQMPQQVARNAVVSQIDLMALVKPHKQTASADLLIFDIHGSFTGNWGKHQWLPPRENEFDWEIGVEGLQYVMNEYNTFEIVPPASARKDGTWQRINQRQYKNLGSWTANRELYQDVEDSPGDSELVLPPGVRQRAATPLMETPPETFRHEHLPAVEMLKGAGGEFSLEAARAMMKKGGAGRFLSDSGDTEEWLESWGYQIYHDPVLGQSMVKKVQ